MNQQIKRSEADIIRDGLDTFMSVIAERDRLLNENALLHQEVELKRARIAEAIEDERRDQERIAAAARELETERAKNARLRTLLDRFVEFLGGAQTILSQAVAEVVPLVPTDEPQTMREAIGADIREHMSGDLPVPTTELTRFAEIWGGQAPEGSR